MFIGITDDEDANNAKQEIAVLMEIYSVKINFAGVKVGFF
jgi:hypothetical protein